MKTIGLARGRGAHRCWVIGDTGSAEHTQDLINCSGELHSFLRQ